MIPEPNAPSDSPPSKFSQLVMMLSTSALQLMGRIPNPVSGKTEIHLADAQATIDVIEMLAEKTQGNLDKDEEQLLGEALTSLRMAYVMATREGAPAQPAPPAEPEPGGTTPPEQGADIQDHSASADKKPKFQKKYD